MSKALEIERCDLRIVTEQDIASCFGLMRQLRPHLVSSDEFAERWRRQSAEGYSLLALWVSSEPVALAGYRIMETLVHGRFLYVDDLVTDARVRRYGCGARLIAHLKSEAVALGCGAFVLDTAIDNMLAHRFYYRQGLFAKALRFSASPP